jgi:hypothetical protein
MTAAGRAASSDQAVDLEQFAHGPPEAGSLDPLMFLDWLAFSVPPGAPVRFTRSVKGWVQEQHLFALFARLDSKTPCAPVVHARSSYLPPASTVGAEAALMIDGFRDGAYPSRLHAGRAGSAHEMREWWRHRKSAPAVHKPGG